MFALMLAAALTFQGVVTKVTDGDTVKVHVPTWEQTPFSDQSLRVFGIDTPESHKPPAKCALEITRGKAAAVYARTLLQPGQVVTFVYHGQDKYGGRIDADIILPDGRDWGSIMITNKYAAPYAGGTKQSWCKK